MIRLFRYFPRVGIILYHRHSDISARRLGFDVMMMTISKTISNANHNQNDDQLPNVRELQGKQFVTRI
jgi:hypothetical protein